MGEISYDDKLRMPALYEKKFGAKAIVGKYPHKGWKIGLSTVKKICQRIDRAGSAVKHQPGSGRPAVS